MKSVVENIVRDGVLVGIDTRDVWEIGNNWGFNGDFMDLKGSVWSLFIACCRSWKKRVYSHFCFSLITNKNMNMNII